MHRISYVAQDRALHRRHARRGHARHGLLPPDAAAGVALVLNAYFTREHGWPNFRLALAAAVLFAAALVLWWIVVHPVNVELTKWVNGPVPSDWVRWRARWEWGHAFNTLLQLAGFATLIWSVLEEGSPSKGR